VNCTLPLKPLYTKLAISVAEESAVRAVAAMAGQTAGLQVSELLLPKNYLQEYKDSRSPQEREEEMDEIEVDHLTEETEEEISESDEGSDFDDDDDEDNGKGKARQKAKDPAKSAKGGKSKSMMKLTPAGQVLNELVGYLYSYS